MPATTEAQLYDFESQWDSAIKTVLDAIAPTYTPSTPLESASTPYIKAEFNQRGVAGPASALLRGQTSELQPDAFEGEIVINLVTNRQKSGAPNLLRGSIRAIMLPKAQAFNVALLPWLEVLSLEETSSARDTDQDLDTDVTALTYKVIYGIRPDAWPVA